MSRRKKSLPQASAPISVPQAAGPTYGFGNSGGGYTAANSSPDRGYIYWPQLDNRTALTQFTRTETTKKARWLEGNTGLGRHFANSIPMMAGPLMPQPSTTDAKWNKAALEFFMRTQGSRMIHDQTGAESFFARQKTVLKRGGVDGDCLLLLTRTTTGNARTVFYESPQIGNAAGMDARTGWYDGVQIDKYGKKINYCILEAGTYNRKGTIIPASQVLHCGQFESPQSPRGLTAFIHAILRMLDIREMDSDTMKGIKAANMVGFYLTNQVMDGIQSAPAGGRLQREDYRGTTRTNVPSPTKTTFEEVLDTGGNMLTLNGGEIKTVNDSRRHPNQQAVIDYFIQDCAAGFRMPYEVMWRIAGITGPAVRFVMRMAEKRLNEIRESLKEQFCQPYWSYTIALAIKNGQLPACTDPDWWKCNWIAPSALTIDAGRDSAAGIREIEVGAQTLQDWYGEDGQDWRKQLDQRGAELAYAAEIEAKHGLPEGAVLGQRELNQPEQAANTQE
jgi:capsid protein